MKNKKYKIFLLMFFSLTISGINRIEAKVYEVNRDETIRATISKDEPTRVRVEYDRIQTTAANNNYVSTYVDEERGEAYILPISQEKKVVNIYITTEKGYTYQLALTPKNIDVVEPIIIKKTDSTLNNYSASTNLRRENRKNETIIEDNSYFNFVDDYKASIINLLKYMSKRTKASNFTVINRDNDILNYGKNIRAEWLYSYIFNNEQNISGEIIKITNISKETLNLSEKEFFRKGIIAVKLDNYTIEPKKSTFVYVIGGGN